MSNDSMLDTNIHLDVLTRDPTWYQWSADAMRSALGRGRIVVNPVIYAELAPGYFRAADLDRALLVTGAVREALPWDGAFMAGQIYLEYRRRGGVRTAPLPDFFIGAHALVRGYTLVTRDAARFRTYFPELRLITP